MAGERGGLRDVAVPDDQVVERGAPLDTVIGYQPEVEVLGVQMDG